MPVIVVDADIRIGVDVAVGGIKIHAGKELIV
jgi:hypothetical protein